MIVYNEDGFKSGYNSITEQEGKHSNMKMDFGILRLPKGKEFRSSEEKERAFLLMEGKLKFSWGGQSREVVRTSLLDELPFVLHVCSGEEIVLEASEDAELCVQKIKNPEHFDAVFYEKDMIRRQRFGEGTMQDTSTRIVRTVFDAQNAPKSAMVLGEVVNYPGKWSSYPPHNHPQPEIYHYRFPLATQGFGFGQMGDAVHKLTHESTLLIEPWLVHPQTAAPGYPMYYLWMIPHLTDAKFGPDSRVFVPDHSWLLDSNARIWPD